MFHCLADIAGPFYDPRKPFRNWSALPYYQLDLPRPPYVDRAQLAWGLARAERHLAQLHAQGYTGIVIDNLPHLVLLDRAPQPVYAPEDQHRVRAMIYRAAFRRLFVRAAQLGMHCFVTCDMQWATPAVRRFAGRLAPENPRLQAINQAALEELFAELPQTSGVVVRVGEAGGAHNQGDDYTGHMIYTGVESLRALIDTLLPVCERHGKLLIVRTWSIGIGELGDLMWSPERYREAFGGYTSPNLVISIKHGPSDFFRHMPPNPTLGLPGPKQLIELQNRREYELFGMTPSGIARLHQQVFRAARTEGSRCAGVWAWNGSGGWGGGRAALASEGWSVWTELSSALTAALAGDPELDAPAFVRGWCEEQFGSRAADEDSAGATGGSVTLEQSAATCPSPFAAAVADLYLDSEQLVERGWYLGPLGRARRSLGSTYLPSLLWVWWMRPTASLIFWAYLASAVANDEESLALGAEALASITAHAERLAALAPPGDSEAEAVVASARYLRDLLVVAQALRRLMLPALAAAWSRDERAWMAQAGLAREVRETLRMHRAAWGANRDLPALELDEVEAFLNLLERAPAVVWRQARLACVVVRRLRAGKLSERHVYAAGMGAATLLLALLARKSRRGAGIAGALATGLLVAPVRRRAIKAAVPWVSKRLFLLPSIFFETGPSFTEWTA
jgi:hypothetical protein